MALAKEASIDARLPGLPNAHHPPPQMELPALPLVAPALEDRIPHGDRVVTEREEGVMRRRKVIVCGGRDFGNLDFVSTVLDRIDRERGIDTIVHGNAAGADSMAKIWAFRNGRREWSFPAEWSKYGLSAGPRRNKQMLGSGAKLVIAFPGGKGTRNMVKQAKSAGLEVIQINLPSACEPEHRSQSARETE